MTTTEDSPAGVDAGLDPDPHRLAVGWLAGLTAAIADGDRDQLVGLLGADSWWRDQLVLGWDLRTHRGADPIADVVAAAAPAAGLTDLAPTPDRPASLVDAGDGVQYVQAFFGFRTAVGRGEGVLRMLPDADGVWRAWTVLTALSELTGSEERTGHRRPVGNPHGRSGPTWAERREREQAFEDREPEVVIVGGGQSGLALGARLSQMGVDALIVDAQPRVGDAWRNRYRSLSLHDPVWYDHMPYLNFPETWPVYMPKDKIADWLEHYAGAFDLNVWTSSRLVSGDYDDAAGVWTVVVRREDGTERTLRPQHLVMATGITGRARVPSFHGQDGFAGVIEHSSTYQGTSDVAGRRAVVVGAATSGHDIAQDLHDRGAQVTMVQRSSTYVMSTEHGVPALMGGLYEQDGPPTEVADLLFVSFPHDLLGRLHVGLTESLKQADAELLAGLERAGFALDFGEDGSGLFMKVLRKASGYYIDVGASELIISGAIAVAQGAGVERFEPDAVVLTDGRRLEADLVVLATGYETVREQVGDLLGEATAGRMREAWGLDEEGELNGAWRPTGHPGLWYMVGNLAMGRYYSRIVALQLAARLRGVVPA